jgi:hypothetical protein
VKADACTRSLSSAADPPEWTRTPPRSRPDSRSAARRNVSGNAAPPDARRIRVAVEASTAVPPSGSLRWADRRIRFGTSLVRAGVIVGPAALRRTRSPPAGASSVTLGRDIDIVANTVSAKRSARPSAGSSARPTLSEDLVGVSTSARVAAVSARRSCTPPTAGTIHGPASAGDVLPAPVRAASDAQSSLIDRSTSSSECDPGCAPVSAIWAAVTCSAWLAGVAIPWSRPSRTISPVR